MLTPAFTVMDSCVVAVVLVESVTVTPKLLLPAAVGLPLSTPAGERVIPAGIDVPLDTDQVYPDPDPPVAVSVVEV